MFDPSMLALGITLVVLGVGFFLLTRLSLRFIPRIQPRGLTKTAPSLAIEIDSHNEAVLVVQMGGRLSYSNPQAREWFGLREEDLNLETIARRTQPSEAFLALCSQEGRARLSIEGRLVEAISYTIPNGSTHATLVSMRPVQPVGKEAAASHGDEVEGRVNNWAEHLYLETIPRLHKALASSLDLESTLQAILESLESLLPTGVAQVAIWNPEEGRLTPYRLAGLPGQERRVEEGVQRFQPNMGLSGRVIATRQPVLLPQTNFEDEGNPISNLSGDLDGSYLGVPLLAAGELIGTLELSAQHTTAFREGDIKILELFASQAAVTLQNALLRQEKQRGTQALSRLAQLAHADDPLKVDDVFGRILEIVSPLLNVEMLGFLTYDETSSRLRGQVPFQGLPSQLILDLYQVDIPPNSPAEEVWLNGETIIATNPPEDSRLQVLGLDHLARAAGMHQTVLTPIHFGDKALGYIQAANKRDGKPFNQDDLGWLSIIAHLAAPIFQMASFDRSALLEMPGQTGDQKPLDLIHEGKTDQDHEGIETLLRSQQIEITRSQSILEAVAEGVLVTDAQNKITLFNASAERILALDRQEVLGQSLEHFVGVFGGAAPEWMPTIRRWSADPPASPGEDIYTKQMTLDDGRVVSVHLAPVIFQKEFLGTVSIFHDITHQVEVDRLKTEFVAIVSHELRTPMTSIKGYVDLLLMGAAGSLSEQQAHFLEIVRSNTERLTVLVNDLLDISRIEAQRLTIAFQSLDLESMCEQAIAEFRRRSQEENKPMDLRIEMAPGLARVTGDPDRVRQILTRLLENAYLYTPEKGLITLRAHQVGDQVQVDVQDTGIGIPLEEQDKVFDRFYRGENPLVLGIPGTGLGLSIVQHLVKLHQGRIWLESRGLPGEGSIFSFTLPVYKPGNLNTNFTNADEK